MKLYFVNARLFNEELFNFYLFDYQLEYWSLDGWSQKRTSCFMLAYKKLGNWTAPCPLFHGVGRGFIMLEFIHDFWRNAF